jgi:hypothetical protein
LNENVLGFFQHEIIFYWYRNLIIYFSHSSPMQILLILCHSNVRFCTRTKNNHLLIKNVFDEWLNGYTSHVYMARGFVSFNLCKAFIFVKVLDNFCLFGINISSLLTGFPVLCFKYWHLCYWIWIVTLWHVISNRLTSGLC